jgi:MFS family permease
MYSEQDLREAVSAGAISEEAAEALRSHVAGLRAMPAVDEENFRLVNSFNDIFVTIAAVLLLVAMAGIGGFIAPGVGGLMVAASAWGMAEFFTRKRRMALPSIVLLLAFVGGIMSGLLGMLPSPDPWGDLGDLAAGLALPGAFVLAAIGAWFHWRRFRVPVTVAAGAAAMAGSVITLALIALGTINEDLVMTLILPLVFVAGLAVFAYAMWWDMSDRTRQTRRSDVAFWLHLLAAPMIAHPLFQWLGVLNGETVGVGGALAMLLVYLVFGLVALAVDRRALLVSALGYVLYALGSLFGEFGVVELSVALTALVIGSALLMLSALWPNIRAAVLGLLPENLRDRLPLSAPVSGPVPRPA